MDLKNNLVRDLYWLIAQPSPLKENSISDLPLFPELWKKKLLLQHQKWFYKLDENPKPLIEFISKTKTSRLGIYAERLMYFFFEHSPFIELKLCNYQVIENKVTIGEIDFVIEWAERLIHIELSVKYYLDSQNDDVFENWIGPSGNDNLSKKIEKVITHQLPLCQSVQFRNETKLWAESFFWLGGLFFSNSQSLPNWISQDTNLGSFSNLIDWWKANQNMTKDFHIILRPSWMMDTLNPASNFIIQLSNDISAIQDHLTNHGALLLRNKISERLHFLVSNNWPSPRQRNS